MKNLLTKRKKGFTLTELAVVIAVIAILIAVLVPTFTSILTSARQTADLEECKNAYTQLLTQSDYVGNPDKVANAVFVGSNDYCYMADENGSFDSETCYKVVVLNKTGSSSVLTYDENNPTYSICIPAGDTMYVITGGSEPIVDYYSVTPVENSKVLIYTETTQAVNNTATVIAQFTGKYVVFADSIVCTIEETVTGSYKLTGYSISESVSLPKTTDSNSYYLTLSDDGYCTIKNESTDSSSIQVINTYMSSDAVKGALGITNVELNVLTPDSTN